MLEKLLYERRAVLGKVERRRVLGELLVCSRASQRVREVVLSVESS